MLKIGYQKGANQFVTLIVNIWTEISQPHLFSSGLAIPYYYSTYERALRAVEGNA